MFSSSIVRRGPSCIVKPRSNSNGLRQLSATAAAATAGTRGACRRQAAAFRAAASGQPKKSSSSVAAGPGGCSSRLMLDKEPASVVERWSMCRSRRSLQQRARTFGSGAVVHAPRLKDGSKQSVRPAIGASANRWFATSRDEPADSDTDSDLESEFDSTIFGAASPASAAQQSGDDEPPAKKKAWKVRKPRKRRTSNSEGTPATQPASETEVTRAVAEAATATATKKLKARKPRKRRTSNIEGTPATEPASETEVTPAAAEAATGTATEKLKVRKPRKRRASNSESTPSPEPAAETEVTPAAAEAATATATKKPKARKPRKRRTASKGESTPSPPAEPAEGASTATDGEEKEEDELDSGVDIPESRRAAFERARRAGVAERARETGAPLESDGGDTDSSWSSEEEQDTGDDDDDDGDNVGRSPSYWEEPAEPVRPEGFPFSFSAEGSANAAKPGTQGRKTPQRQEQHPVLGHLVADLEYKRVYVTSINALMQAPVWEKARTLRAVHSGEIFEAKKLEADKREIQMIEAGEIEAIGDVEKKAKGLPGVITLFQRPLLPLTSKNQKYTLGILDGQHRVGAMLLLAQEGLWDRSEQNVVVEVFDTKDDKEIERLFLDINKAEPIDIDLGHPGPEDVQKCADEVVLYLYDEYQPMFSSKRARPPSLHAVTFKENLVRSGMIERHDLYEPELLLDYLMRVNEMLSEREMHLWELMIGKEEGGYPTKKSLQTALKKAKQHDFWLGMELSWMLV